MSLLSMGVLLLILIGLTTCGGLAATAAPQGDAITATPSVQIAAIPPRCDTFDFYRYLTQPVAREQRLAPEDLHSHESHDCQRLIWRNGNDLVYGPLVALWVSTEAISQPTRDFQGGVIAAELVNFDQEEYTQLSISRGVSCLWIQGRDDNDGRNWTARIFQPTQQRCTPASVPAGTVPGGTVLTVRRHLFGDNVNYPSTGRWMWDARRSEQFIGIRCGNAWCELGKAGFPVSEFTASTIPGWSDEQLLAIPGDQGLQVSGLWGRIEPSIGLAELTPAMFRRRGGAHVATITFTGNDDAARQVYATKYPSACSCTHTLRLYMQTANPANPRYQFSTNRVTWTNVVKSGRPHAGRGAVRWAWSDTDEGSWIACEQGCCRTDEKDPN